MTTQSTRTAPSGPVLTEAETKNLLAGLRDRQLAPELAEQRHQFLDSDADLDYTRHPAYTEVTR